VLLSRSHPEFLRKLFSIEVPEIAEGIVQIHGVAREPGERAKIAVSTNDERVDPVGACVGVKGSRVQTIVRELSGERIDIVPWIDEPQIFIGRALSPANVSRVITDSRRKHATVLVDDDQLSLAIGKSGQNSRLAVQLTGWGIDIITEAQYQSRRAKQELIQQLFRKLPDVSELISLSLATSGFDSIRSIAESTLEMLKTVPGLEDENTARTLRDSAEKFLEEFGAAADVIESPPAVVEAGGNDDKIVAAEDAEVPDSSDLPQVDSSIDAAEGGEIETSSDSSTSV
jgi:N utilization substance protein A